VPETCVPTEIRFCGFTVPDALTDATSVCCVTGSVASCAAARERVSVPARIALTSISARLGKSQRGNLARRPAVAPAGGFAAEIGMLDMAA
jgi:hypothetical protein